jgi:hypothetical protein
VQHSAVPVRHLPDLTESMSRSRRQSLFGCERKTQPTRLRSLTRFPTGGQATVTTGMMRIVDIVIECLVLDATLAACTSSAPVATESGTEIANGGSPVDGGCIEPLAQYCGVRPDVCPHSAEQFCQWLAGRGEHSFGGTVQCPGQGTGFVVEERYYLFDDAGLTAIDAIDEMFANGVCLAGSPHVVGDCVILTTSFECYGDAGGE